MNLVTDKYIRVLKTDGSHDIYSLYDIFKNAESIATLECFIHEKVATLSVLAAIAQDALGKILTHEDWEQCRNRIVTSACDYLMEYKKDFELYDIKKPWCQVAVVRETHDKPFRAPFNNLSLDRPFADRTAFSDHFSHLWQPTDEEVANMLVPYSMFDLGCLFKRRNTWQKQGEITGSKSAGPLSKKMLMVVEGQCLLDTIWYHVFPAERMGSLKMGKPFWRLSLRSQKDFEEYASTYHGHLLPIARAVLLDKESRLAFLGETIPSVGGKENGLWSECRHPMMIEYTITKGKKPVKIIHGTADIKPDQEVWRQLGSVMSLNNDPSKIAWAFGHARTKGKLFVYTGGLTTGSAEINGPVESSFCILPECDRNGWVDSYTRLFKKADHICFRLKCAINVYAESMGIRPKNKLDNLDDVGKRIYWSNLSNHVNILFKASDIESPSCAENQNKWINICWREAFKAYDTIAAMYNDNSCEAYGLGRAKLQTKETK